MASAKTKTIDGKKYLQWGNPAVGRSVYYEAGPVAVQLQRLEQNIQRCFHPRILYNRLKSLKDTTRVLVSESHRQLMWSDHSRHGDISQHTSTS